MGQCLHLDKSGQPCLRPTAEGDLFCLEHQAPEERGFRLAAWRRFLFRVAAAALLLLFALQGYLILKAVLGR